MAGGGRAHHTFHKRKASHIVAVAVAVAIAIARPGPLVLVSAFPRSDTPPVSMD